MQACNVVIMYIALDLNFRSAGVQLPYCVKITFDQTTYTVEEGKGYRWNEFLYGSIV